MEGGLEKILLKSFSTNTRQHRPISSDIKHGEKSLPLKSGRGRMNKGRKTQHLLPRLLTEGERGKKNIKNGWGSETLKPDSHKHFTFSFYAALSKLTDASLSQVNKASVFSGKWSILKSGDTQWVSVMPLVYEGVYRESMSRSVMAGRV